VSTKDVLDAILGLGTQFVEATDKILEAVTKAVEPAEEKEVEPEVEPEEDVEEVDLAAIKEEILSEVKSMLHELRQPVARKSAVEMDDGGEEPNYQEMSRKELEASLKEKLASAFPDRI